MNTNNNIDSKLSAESEKLKNELAVAETIVQNSRDRYAEELGGTDAVSQMRRLASVKPKTYPIPKRVRKVKHSSKFFHKIKVLLGLEK